jgi:hypothetical protein
MKNIINTVSPLFSQDEMPWFPWLLRVSAVLLGLIHTWAASISYSMNADGISYLDMGDAYMRGDWEVAINSVWSPMYSWILGIVLNIVKPPMEFEFPLVHMVNFMIYLLALVCFEFLWRQLRKYQQSIVLEEGQAQWSNLPHWIWWGLGYSIFVFASLHLIQIWAVTPDMLMSAFVYLAAGLLVQMHFNDESRKLPILFGSVLGLGYLGKAVMLPISILFLVVYLVSASNLRQRLPRALTSALFFLLFSAPFIIIVSSYEGRFTFSDAGTLTYVRYINGVSYPHWQGDPPGNGTPMHPSRLIHDNPPIYEFGEPVGGTYPISYNPFYWYEGVTIRRDISRQIDYVLFSLMYYFDVLFRQQAGLFIGVMALYRMSGLNRLRSVDYVLRWGLTIIAIAGFGLYGLVNVIGRYIGVFTVLFWGGLLANIRVSNERQTRNLASFIGVIIIVFLAMNIVVINFAGFRDLSGKPNPHQTVIENGIPPRWPGEVSQKLHQLGVRQGDKVALIGYGFDAFWARLARVKIVAEMPDSQATNFWLGDDTLRQEVLQAFADTGAKAIIAEYVPGYAQLSGWHQVGNSNYYIYVFTEQ